jgi:hypothetical protein
MKTNDNLPDVRALLSGKDLVISEDKEKGTCTIHKP